MNPMNPNKIQWKHLISVPQPPALLLLPRESFPGELLQRAVPGQPARQHHAALRADLQLGPLRAVLFCNEDIMILSKIVEIVSSQL